MGSFLPNAQGVRHESKTCCNSSSLQCFVWFLNCQEACFPIKAIYGSIIFNFMRTKINAC